MKVKINIKLVSQIFKLSGKVHIRYPCTEIATLHDEIREGFGCEYHSLVLYLDKIDESFSRRF